MNQPLVEKIYRLAAMPTKRRLVTFAAVAAALAIGRPSVAETSAKHGGTLEFAVTVEPGNYDCHGNISFAFLHPIAPHYSTLLKFDAANYPRIIGDLAESWSVAADRLTYSFKLRPNVLFHDGAQGRLRRHLEHRYARPAHRRFPSAVARGGDAGEFRLSMELHLQRRQARPGPRISQSSRARHRSIRLCRVRKGKVLAGPALGQIFSARQALSRRLPGRFRPCKCGDDGVQKRPHRRRVPGCDAPATRRPRRGARRPHGDQ